MVGVLWFFLWLVVGFDEPASHPRISMPERNYIESSIQESEQKVLYRWWFPWDKNFTVFVVCLFTPIFLVNHGNFIHRNFPLCGIIAVGYSFHVAGFISSLASHPQILCCLGYHYCLFLPWLGSLHIHHLYPHVLQANTPTVIWPQGWSHILSNLCALPLQNISYM